MRLRFDVCVHTFVPSSGFPVRNMVQKRAARGNDGECIRYVAWETHVGEPRIGDEGRALDRRVAGGSGGFSSSCRWFKYKVNERLQIRELLPDGGVGQGHAGGMLGRRVVARWICNRQMAATVRSPFLPVTRT